MILIDALTYAYRRGAILYPEQQASIVYAIESMETQYPDMNSDTVLAAFLITLESLGFHRRTHLYKTLEEFISSPDFFRQRFPGFFYIPKEGLPIPQLITDNKVTFLMEPLLSIPMQKRFEQDFWDFKRNHEECFATIKKNEATPQLHLGVYAHTPQDNAATLERLELHFRHLCNHTNANVRQAYENFPLRLMMKILKRSYP